MGSGVRKSWRGRGRRIDWRGLAKRSWALLGSNPTRNSRADGAPQARSVISEVLWGSGGEDAEAEVMERAFALALSAQSINRSVRPPLAWTMRAFEHRA